MPTRDYGAETRKFIFWILTVGITMKMVMALFLTFVRIDHHGALILACTAILPAVLHGCICRWYAKNGWWT